MTKLETWARLAQHVENETLRSSKIMLYTDWGPLSIEHMGDAEAKAIVALSDAGKAQLRITFERDTTKLSHDLACARATLRAAKTRVVELEYELQIARGD